jgi:hypothetical protein
MTLALAFRGVEFPAIIRALSASDWRFILMALASVAVNTLAKAVRWRTLLGEKGEAVRMYSILLSLLQGQLLNTVFPARLGELSRAHTIGQLGPGRIYVLSTLVVEKLLDMICYAILFMMMVVLVPLPGWMHESGIVIASLGVLSLIGLVAAVRNATLAGDLLKKASHPLPQRWQSALGRWSDSAISSLSVLKKPAETYWLAGWSILVWAAAVLTNALTLLALGIQLPIRASILVLVAVQAGITIPSIPGRVGVFEYLCVLSLALFGVEQLQAVSYGILLHAIVFIPTTLLSLLAFWVFRPGAGDSRIFQDAGER